jgi:hypothetical protein
MKTEQWGNYADGQFQGLTASKFLPQLTQDAFLLCRWYADTPRKWMPDLQVNRAVLRLVLKAGGAGGLRRDFEVATDLGLSIPVGA